MRSPSAVRTSSKFPNKAFPPVSVFQLQVSSKEDQERAERYANELKRLRSPHILHFVDVVMANPVLLVTQQVLPLEAVKEKLSYSQLVLSMAQTMEALDFLHAKAGVSHNNVCLACVFVHNDADLNGVATFKLGGLEFCSDSPSSNGNLSTHPQPPESPRDGSPKPAEGELKIHVRDVFQLGYMLPQCEFFFFFLFFLSFSPFTPVLDMNNGASEEIRNLSKKMRAESPNLRPTIRSILWNDFFCGNSFLNVFSFLRDFRAASEDAKKEFFDAFEFELGKFSSRDFRSLCFPPLFVDYFSSFFFFFYTL